MGNRLLFSVRVVAWYILPLLLRELSLIKAGIISVKVLVIKVILNDTQRIAEATVSNRCSNLLIYKEFCALLF